MLEIGVEVEAFDCGSLNMIPEMQDLIGEVGTIVATAESHVKLMFFNDPDKTWWYPVAKAAKHIVKPIDKRMEVKVKRLHPDSVIPSYATKGDAGLDLTAVSKSYDEYGNTVFDTGLAFEIPEGFVGLLFPRSSNAKTNLRLTNAVGVLDSGYRGSVLFKYRNHGPKDIKVYDAKTTSEYKVGDRIGQLIIMPYPQIKLVEAEELSTTERGEGAYGSSGK